MWVATAFHTLWRGMGDYKRDFNWQKCHDQSTVDFFFLQSPDYGGIFEQKKYIVFWHYVINVMTMDSGD